MAQRFLIAPMNSGLRGDLPPWQLPENAFERLQNAYVFRGKVTKRLGAKLMGSGASSSETAPLRSRLRENIGVSATPAATYTLDINVAVGQQFSIGDVILTVVNAAAPSPLLTTNPGITGVVGPAANQVTIDDMITPGTTVFLYPGLPVMGITNYETGSINNQPTIAFDTRFAYQFVSTAWIRIDNTTQWQGDDLDYFWATNWEGITDNIILLFVTNFNATVPAPAGTDDPMYYWNGTVFTNFSALTVFNAATDFVQTARIILPFKDRLILLNTIERDVGAGTNLAFPNRCRFSHNGSPISTTAWYEPNVAFGGNSSTGGGFIDAPTKEEIISAEFIKDRLIVYFERSCWELAYTGNQVLPFVWQQLNSELGAMGTFSVTPFDKVVLAIGDTGVHACNGSNVERIDDNIPNKVFEISKKQEGAKRVAGIRDYVSELVYWSYPSAELNVNNTRRFPDKMLVYNYANGSWALWDDTFTAFGYFYQQSDLTWADLFQTWQEYDQTWIAGIELQQNRNVIAGNQQGYVVLLLQDLDINAQVYTITNVGIVGSVVTFTVINHTMQVGDFIYILDLNGITGFAADIYQINSITGANTFTIVQDGWGGTYTGGGTYIRVSRIDILSKEWNPFISQGRSVYVPYIDFCVHRTANGEITVDYFASGSDLDLIPEAQATGMILGTNVLETRPYATIPFEQTQRRLWHRVYFQTDGQFMQIRIYLSDEQMLDPSRALSDFTLEGLILNAEPTSYDLEI